MCCFMVRVVTTFEEGSRAGHMIEQGQASQTGSSGDGHHGASEAGQQRSGNRDKGGPKWVCGLVRAAALAAAQWAVCSGSPGGREEASTVNGRRAHEGGNPRRQSRVAQPSREGSQLGQGAMQAGSARRAGKWASQEAGAAAKRRCCCGRYLA